MRTATTTKPIRPHRVLISGLPAIKALKEWTEYLDHIGATPRTIARYRSIVTQFLEQSQLSLASVSEIDEKHVGKWLNARDPRKLGTRKNQLATLNVFFEYLNAKGWIVGVPSKLARIRMENLTFDQKEPTPKKPFSDEEVYRLLVTLTKDIGDKTRLLRKIKHDQNFLKEAVDKLENSLSTLIFWRSAIALGRWTGLRLGDICQLEWSCFSAAAGFITVWTDKRDKRVQVPVPPELELFLVGIPKQDKTYLFPHQHRLIRDENLRATLSVQFKRLCQKCGIQGKSFHCLRYTFVSECLKQGIEMPHISKLVGHSSSTTTQHYAQPQ